MLKSMLKDMTNTAEHATCQGCGRKIWSAASIAAGRGSGCRAKLRKATQTADLTVFHGWQVEKARDAIELGAIVALSREGIYAAVSGDGVTVYVVDAIERSCTCKSRVPCYHLCGGLILFAASSAGSNRKAA
jgi:hypothetical protein